MLTSRFMLGIGISSVSMNFIRMIFLAAVPSYMVGAQVFVIISGIYLIACAINSFFFIRNH